MRKPRITVCLLALATVLWAARPVALADGIDWLTLGDIPEAGETAPEPGEGPSAVSELSRPAPGGPDGGEAPGLAWLTAGSGVSNGGREKVNRPEEEPEEESRRDTPEPVTETERLPRAQSAVPEPAAAVEPEFVEREPEFVEQEPEWLTADESVAAAENPAVGAPEEEQSWLAVEAPAEEAETKSEAEAAPLPDGGALIEVTVPASGDMIINPYRMPVKIGEQEIQDQIINFPQLLTNNSAVPVIVTASVTVNAGESSGVTITERAIGKDETEKLANLYVEFQNVPDRDSEAAWSGGYTGASNQLLASGGGTVSGDVLRVEAGDKIPSYASYRLFGSLTENPAAGWQAGDKLSVTVSFTFRPAEEAEPEGEPETAEEADESAAEPEEIPEMKDKAEAKPEEAPKVAPEPRTEPDPGPEPKTDAPEAAYEPAVSEREEEPKPSKPRSEGLDSFATGTNPDWMRPPE